MDLEIGKEAGGFYIESVLGQGGMGVVYKAQDVALARDVALKVIKPELARDEQFVRRFQTEARVLAKLNSPNIVGVHALQQTESGLFIVMEYVEGGDLSELLTGSPLPVKRAIEITKQLLRAIQRAHDAGVIHRDIKPQNIMVSGSGEIKVTDFGLAKLRQTDMMSTMTQGVVGTLYYMAPEQVRGEEIDARADVWAVGVVLFEMLVGERPFTAEHEAGVMYSLLSNDPEIPEAILSTLPSGLSEIVSRVLAKDREDRFASASEMMTAIEEMERPSGAATPAAIREESSTADPNPSKRWTGMVMGAGAIALIVAAGYLYLPGLLGSGAPVAGTAALTLDSRPSGAEVSLNGVVIGSTPIENHPLTGTGEGLQIGLRMAGFASVDTVLLGGADHMLTLSALEQALTTEQSTDNTPNSDGSTDPASTSTDDARLPATDDPSQSVTEEPAVVANNDPAPVEAPAAIATGTVSLSVAPAAGATVSIDGGPPQQPGSITLPVGSHTVKFQTSDYGEIQEVVVITAGANQPFTCHFEAMVRIPGTNPRAHVYLDGVATGDSTPAELILGPGDYEVSAQLFGYTVVLAQGVGSISIAPSCSPTPDRTLVFELTETGP